MHWKINKCCNRKQRTYFALLYNLKNLALKNNVELKIGCTTGGALPSVNVGTKDVLGAQVTEIIGVLNGTTNFILEEC